METAFSINVKWPQMYVTGKRVTIEQAKEIIRRTDTFFTHGYGGNDREWDKKVRDLLRLNDLYGFHYDYSEDFKPPPVEERRKRHEAFNKKWQPVLTRYVHNTWMSSAFIGGPYGWCHPDGTIGFTHNIGKWPDAEDVIDDWKVIVEAFPFLDVGVTIMDEEGTMFPLDVGEEPPKPNFSIRVKDGQVTVVDPEKVNVHGRHQPATTLSRNEILCLGDLSREHGIPWEWIEEWAVWASKEDC